MTFPKTFSLIAPLTLLLAAACDTGVTDDRFDRGPDADPDRDPSLDEPNAARGTVNGMVSGDVQTQAVTAFRVQDDGSLVAISESTDVKADGSFSLDVLIDDESDNTVIIADSDSTTSINIDAGVIVTADIEEDGQATTADIDNESSLETAVFVDLVVDGNTDADGSEAGLIGLIVTADVAAEATADGDNSNDVDAIADLTLGVLITLDASDDELDVANETQASADASGEDVELSVDTLFGLGFDEDGLSIGLHAAAELSEDAASDSDATETEIAFAETMARLRAEISTRIVEDGLLSLDLDSEANADVEDSNDGLLGGILNADITAALELSSAWSEWAGDLQAILTANLSIESQGMLQDADDAASEAEIVLEASLATAFETETDAMSRAEAAASAMAEYEATVRADARVQALAQSDLGEDGAEAMADVLVQLHASVD